MTNYIPFGVVDLRVCLQTSHLEKGWLDNIGKRSVISYQDAFALNLY